MGRFDTTKATINANIKKNGNQEITGSILNSVMTEMVDATDAQLTELSDETNMLQELPLIADSYYGAYGKEVGDSYTSTITKSEGVGVYSNHFSVKEGQRYRLKGKGNPYTYRGYFLTNSNDVITRIISDDTYDLMLTIENGEANLYCNFVDYNADTDGIWIAQKVKEVVTEHSQQVAENSEYIDKLKLEHYREDLSLKGKLDFVTGSFSGNGKELISNTRVRIVGVVDDVTMNLPDGYLVHEVFYYNYWNSNDDFSLNRKVVAASQNYRIYSEGCVARYSIRKADNSVIDSSEVMAIFSTNFLVLTNSTKELVTELNLSNADILQLMKANIEDKRVSFIKKIGKKFVMRAYVQFPNNIHDITEDIILFSLNDWKIHLLKGVPQSVTNGIGVCPVPQYVAGIKAEYLDYNIGTYTPDGWKKVNLLGEDTMTIRFKGDCSASSNQDIRINVNAESVRIYHSQNNATIAEYIKSNYSTLEELYRKMKADENGSLSGFEVGWLSIEGYSPADIIKCDVPLVSQHYTDNSQTTLEHRGFPYYFTAKEKNREHIIEVIVDGEHSWKTQFLLDGYCLAVSENDNANLSDKSVLFTIFNNEESGIVVNKIEFDDSAVSAFPNMRMIFYEGIKEGLEYEQIQTSQKRVAAVGAMMAEYGVSSITMNDMLKVLDGSLKSESYKLCHMTHDDNAAMVVTNPSIRATYYRKGIYPSIAFFTDTIDNIASSDIEILKASQFNGVELHPHGGKYSRENSICFLDYENLKEDVQYAINKIVEKFGALPIAWNNHNQPINYNVVAYLRSVGFATIISMYGAGQVTNTTRYCLSHFHPLDTNPLTNLEKLYTSYLSVL